MNRADEIRKEILFQAYALRPLHVSASRIHRSCLKQQMDFSEVEIKRELPFLVGEELLERVVEPGVTELHFTISAKGVRHYEQNFAA